MNLACRYCKLDFVSVGIQLHSRRVICGADVCRKRYQREYNREKRADDNATTIQDTSERTQGRFTVPSAQGKLDKAMRGQFAWCPGCGEEHILTTTDQRVECKCGALWTYSVGQAENGDVVIVRMDRWR